MPQDWGPVVYSGSAITSTFPVDDTAICKQAPKPHVVLLKENGALQVQCLSLYPKGMRPNAAQGMGNLVQCT